jgi:hypothetical protein
MFKTYTLYNSNVDHIGLVVTCSKLKAYVALVVRTGNKGKGKGKVPLWGLIQH